MLRRHCCSNFMARLTSSESAYAHLMMSTRQTKCCGKNVGIVALQALEQKGITIARCKQVIPCFDNLMSTVKELSA
jgi:hypothetical protein